MCFKQEVWTMLFVFCIREKSWCEFVEFVDGELILFLQGFVEKYNMVIVSFILERDVVYGEIIWNIVVIIGNRGNIIGKYRKVFLFFSFCFYFNDFVKIL